MSDPVILKARRGSSAFYSSSLVAPNGDALRGSQIDSIKASITHVRTGEVINDRNGETDLFNSDIFVDESGHLTWELEPDDNDCLTDSDPESHYVVLAIAWGGTRLHYHVFQVDVENPAAMRLPTPPVTP